MASKTTLLMALTVGLAGSTALYAVQAGAQSPPASQQPGTATMPTRPVPPPPPAPPPPPPPPPLTPFPGTPPTTAEGSDAKTADRIKDAGDMQHRGRGQFTAEDRAAFFEARIAGLKAGLQLSNDQDKLWPAVEQALRDYSAMRRTERDQMREGPRPDNRYSALRAMAERSAQRGDVLMRLADAIEPFQASLSADQRRRLPILIPPAYVGLFESKWEDRFERPSHPSTGEAGRQHGRWGQHDRGHHPDHSWRGREDREDRGHHRDWQRSNEWQRETRGEDGAPYRRFDDEDRPYKRPGRAYFDEDNEN